MRDATTKSGPVDQVSITARELRHLADRFDGGNFIIGPLALRNAADTIDQVQAALNKANLDAAELRYELAKPTLFNLVPRKDADEAVRKVEARENKLSDAHEALQRDYNELADRLEASRAELKATIERVEALKAELNLKTAPPTGPDHLRALIEGAARAKSARRREYRDQLGRPGDCGREVTLSIPAGSRITIEPRRPYRRPEAPLPCATDA